MVSYFPFLFLKYTSLDFGLTLLQSLGIFMPISVEFIFPLEFFEILRILRHLKSIILVGRSLMLEDMALVVSL